MIDESIFREYDIRGIVPEQINELSIKAIASAIATKCYDEKVHELALGRDGRLSGSKIINALSQELRLLGINIVNVGIVTSPLLYFAAKKLNSMSGVMITGSHNPKNYNGFKIVINDKPVSGTEMLSLISNEIIHSKETGSEIFKEDLMKEYISEVITQTSKSSKKIKVVIDCGNGSAGEIAPRLMRTLGHEVIELFCEIDGNFPNHHPDPGKPENLQDLIRTVKKEGADIGIAFDGDGDRIGVIDKNRLPVPGDLLTAFLANSIKDKVNKTVILDIKSSNVAYEKIMSLGFNAEIGKTGHSNIKKRIKEINAPLAGEMSGHIFFADNYFGFDDAIYASIRLIKLLANDITLHEFTSSLPVTYPSREIKVYCPDNVKFKTMKNISIEVLKNYNSKDIITIDGIRAKNKFGWWLIRASNTEEALVVRFEGNSGEDKNELFNEVKYLLENEGLTLETI